MKDFCLILLAVLSLRAAESTSFPSPDGRFAVRTTDAADQSFRNIIEVKSGRALVELNGPFRAKTDPVLWSANSRWVAYANHGGRVADTSVLFWDGTEFTEVELPPMIDPELKFPPTKPRGTEVETLRSYASQKPLRWLKSGALVIESVVEVYRLEPGEKYVNYSRRSVFIVGFGKKQRASVLDVAREKQKTEVTK